MNRSIQAPMYTILKKLQGGDRRSIGRVDEVVDRVLGSAPLFEELINGLFADDPVLRMRAADAVEMELKREDNR